MLFIAQVMWCVQCYTQCGSKNVHFVVEIISEYTCCKFYFVLIRITDDPIDGQFCNNGYTAMQHGHIIMDRLTM